MKVCVVLRVVHLITNRYRYRWTGTGAGTGAGTGTGFNHRLTVVIAGTGTSLVESMEDTEVDEAEAFAGAFQDEVADFHMACADDAADAAERVLSHVATLRAMVTDGTGDSDDISLRRELHGACVAKAAAWVERRIQDLVAEFHLRWHEDADLLAVDRALRESITLVGRAEVELGPLPVCAEVLAACDQQLRTRLAAHVRRANRHELRMLFADFCEWSGREELQRLCLDKYREQVDKHVQSEAVATQIKLMNLISARTLQSTVAAGEAATAAEGGAGGGGGGSTAGAQGVEEGGEPMVINVLREYLEGVAGLREELAASELPAPFAASVLLEVEHEACTQALELSSQVRRFHSPASAVPLPSVLFPQSLSHSPRRERRTPPSPLAFHTCRPHRQRL